MTYNIWITYICYRKKTENIHKIKAKINFQMLIPPNFTHTTNLRCISLSLFYCKDTEPQKGKQFATVTSLWMRSHDWMHTLASRSSQLWGSRQAYESYQPRADWNEQPLVVSEHLLCSSHCLNTLQVSQWVFAVALWGS